MPRPLSPYEAMTGDRFSDHRTFKDTELDDLLEEAMSLPEWWQL